MREINKARQVSSAQNSQALFAMPGIEAEWRPAPPQVKAKEVVA